MVYHRQQLVEKKGFKKAFLFFDVIKFVFIVKLNKTILARYFTGGKLYLCTSLTQSAVIL